jgi:hypothetical protein
MSEKQKRINRKKIERKFDYYDTVRRAAQIIFADNSINAGLFVM